MSSAGGAMDNPIIIVPYIFFYYIREPCSHIQGPQAWIPISVSEGMYVSTRISDNNHMYLGRIAELVEPRACFCPREVLPGSWT